MKNISLICGDKNAFHPKTFWQNAVLRHTFSYSSYIIIIIINKISDTLKRFSGGFSYHVSTFFSHGHHTIYPRTPCKKWFVVWNASYLFECSGTICLLHVNFQIMWCHGDSFIVRSPAWPHHSIQWCCKMNNFRTELMVHLAM